MNSYKVLFIATASGRDSVDGYSYFKIRKSQDRLVLYAKWESTLFELKLFYTDRMFCLFGVFLVFQEIADELQPISV